MIEQFVARDGPDPRRERLRGIVDVAFEMNGQQGFLNQILHVRRSRSQAPAKMTAQVSAEDGQQLFIGRAVAAERGDHQRLEPSFHACHA